MRELVRKLVNDARSGDRVGGDGPQDPLSVLSAETIRLARVATSIHLADVARRFARASGRSGLETVVREPRQ